MALDGEWLTYGEAAHRLSTSPDAVRHRVKRGSLQSVTGNDGRPRVWVPDAVRSRPVGAQSGQSAAASDRTAPQSDRGPDASDRIVGFLERQLEHERAEHARQISSQQARHDAETALRISEIQAMHLELVNRITAQAASERAALQERVDAAEIRAEQSAATLTDLINRVLAAIPAPAPSAPWWERWFGLSRRSDIRQ